MSHSHRRLAVSWLHDSSMFSQPGSAIVKLRLGEAPAAIPTALDVRDKFCHVCSRTHISELDHILSHFSDDFHIARLHASALNLDAPSERHLHYDEIEHVVGVSRTFRVYCHHGCAIGDMVDAMQQLAVVEHAYPDYLTVTPFVGSTAITSDGLQEAWRTRERIRAIEAMAYEPGNPAFTVAIADTGASKSHPELQGRLRSGLDTVQLADHSVAPGIELVGDNSRIDDDPDDNVGHGTSCAGIVGALGQGIPPGLAGDCSLMPVRVLGSARFPGKRSLVGIGAISNIDEGMKRAIDRGARVLNMSFGTPKDMLDPDDPVPHEDVVAYGLARNCVMIAASGNSGQEEQYTPAALDGVIAVGAVGDDGRPAPFSTRGGHVSLCAPGSNVVSIGTEGYMRVTGTSFAAPFVAATAGLLVSRANRRSHELSGQEVKEILESSAAPWLEGVDSEGHGRGILDAYRALEVLDLRIDNRASITA